MTKDPLPAGTLEQKEGGREVRRKSHVATRFTDPYCVAVQQIRCKDLSLERSRDTRVLSPALTPTPQVALNGQSSSLRLGFPICQVGGFELNSL